VPTVRDIPTPAKSAWGIVRAPKITETEVVDAEIKDALYKFSTAALIPLPLSAFLSSMKFPRNKITPETEKFRF